MSKKLTLPENHPYKDGRVCTSCNTFKTPEHFTLERDKRAFGGIAMRSKCRPCNESIKYKSFIKRAYNISWEDYEELLKAQNYKCAICENKISSSRTSRLFVDHCHTSGGVRGLLCSACNHGLGLFKDSPKLLKRAISYLTDHKDKE